MLEVQFVLVPFDQMHGTLDDGRAQAIVPSRPSGNNDFSAPIQMTGGIVRARHPTPPTLAAWECATPRRSFVDHTIHERTRLARFQP